MTADVVELSTRRGLTLGGSDAASACGVDPYRSRVMLWAERTGRVERPESEAMLWGTLLQPVIFDVLANQGWNVAPADGDTLRHDEHAWMVGHVDGFGVVANRAAVVEVKTAGTWASHDWNHGRAPVQYVAQCQHYLAVTGLSVALLAVLLAGQRLETRIVERDDALIGALIDAESEMIDYLRRDVPPPPDGSESAAEALKGMFPRSTEGASVRLTRDDMAVVRELRERREQLAAVKRQADTLEQRLRLRMGDAERAVSPDDTEVATWPTFERHALDTKRLRDEHPRIATQYTTTTSYRRFTLK